MKDLLVVIGMIALLIERYQLLLGKWIRGIVGKGKEAKRERKPVVMKLKSERDCPHYVKEKGHKLAGKIKVPIIAWSERKGKGGRKKKVETEGFFCPKPGCEYYGIRSERIHALVGYGRGEKKEEIRDLKYQACGKKFTERRNTILYWLKMQLEVTVRILWWSVLGVDASAETIRHNDDKTGTGACAVG